MAKLQERRGGVQRINPNTSEKKTAKHSRRTLPNNIRKGSTFYAPIYSHGRSDATAERLPQMSPNAREFLMRMEANPHMRAVMRDLADK